MLKMKGTYLSRDVDEDRPGARGDKDVLGGDRLLLPCGDILHLHRVLVQ